MVANVEDMVSVRKPPWHLVGTVVENVMTAQEALKLGGLDWNVALHPLKVYMGADASPRYLGVPDRFGVIRDTDTSVLGIVGKDYVPFQNSEAFEFFDNLVDSGEAKYETAGSLRGGQVVWLTARMPHDIVVAGVDAHRAYLLITTSHDGSRAITAAVVYVRVECENTLNMALTGAARRWSVRHTSSAEGKLAEARETLGMSFKYAAEFESEVEKLIAADFTEQEFRRMVDALVPDTPRRQTKVDTLVWAFVESPNLENVRGTKWAALNAFGEYGDWLRNPRTDESRLIGTWYGGASKLRDRAHAYLVS